MDENNSLNLENNDVVDGAENTKSTQAFTWAPTESDVPESGEAEATADTSENTENTTQEPLSDEAAEACTDEAAAEEIPAEATDVEAAHGCEDTSEETAKNTEEAPENAEETPEGAPEEALENTEDAPEDTSEEAAEASGDPIPPRTPPKHKGFKITLIVMAIVFAVALTLMTISLTVGIFQNIGDATTTYPPTINMEITDKGPTTLEDGLASAELLEDVHNSVVVITCEKEDSTGLGSGFIVSEDGYIVTNQHVIDGALSVTVELYSGKTYTATVVGESALADIAVLKIDAKNLNNIVIGKSENCYVGERVYAIGCPDGYELAWTTTMGIISHTDRKIKIYDDAGALEKTMNLIQTDVAVNHGNSGGPLINTRGEVVGIVTLKISNTAGLGFAIPIDTAMQVVQEIMTTGKADENESLVSSPRAMLGITCVGISADKYYVRTENGVKVVTQEQAEAVGEYILSPVGGIYVIGIDEKYNAKGKLFEGDVIISVDGSTVISNSQLSYYLDDYSAGDTITLNVYRDGAYIDVDILLAREIKN